MRAADRPDGHAHPCSRCSRPAPGSRGSSGCRAPTATRSSRTRSSLDKARSGSIDVYFVGDSITRRWGATDYPELLANWKQNFFGWNAAELRLGRGHDQNILWRLRTASSRRASRRSSCCSPAPTTSGTRPPRRRREGRRHHARHQGGARRDAREGAGGDDHPDGDLSAQRQHRGRRHDQPDQPAPRAFADGKRIRYLDINEKLAGPTGGCSTA